MSDVLRRLWAERAERERTSIGSALVLIALAIAYAYAWLPVTRELDRLLVRVPELRAEAQAMDHDIREVQRLKAAARRGGELKAAIEQAAAARGIALSPSEIVRQGAEDVRIRIASVRASQLFAWIGQLQSSGVGRLESARLISLGDSDRVDVEAIFTQGR